MNRLLGKVLLVAGVLAALTALAVAADWWIAVPADATAKFVGRQACAQCHQQQFDQWQGSHHDLAMDLATPAHVLGDFNDQQITYQGVTSRMFRRGEKHFIHTEGPDGQMTDFEVKYVFGFDPLQQYLVELPDGRVQVLRISWDTHGKRWFYHFPPDVRDEKLQPDDPLHWTGRASNWNHMCAECHSTDVQKNYKPAEDRFETSFHEIDVSCETCHGPASIHVDLAQSNSLFWDRHHGYGLPRLKHEDSKYQIESCAKCHARRRMVYPDYQPGGEFLDYYAPSLLLPGLYHADGQILDEVYVYGSFLQSKMHAKGVRCTDCHDPHTARLKHEGNQICTSCHQHPAGKYDVPAHHHHKTGTAGASCVECHMPSKHYMIVDPRRDHSLRVPRPDLSVAVGTPNACTACHLDTGKPNTGEPDTGEPDTGEPDTNKPRKWEHYADWLAAAQAGDEQARAEIERVDQSMAEAVEKWYGPRKEKTPHFAHALAAARARRPEAEEALTDVFHNKELPGIVRATAVQHLAEIDSDSSRSLVVSAIKDADPLVRAVAVSGLQQRGYSPQELIAGVLPLLDDPVRLVRTEAAAVLASTERFLDAAGREKLQRATDEYRASQNANLDQPAAHYNLANLAQDRGQAKEAIRRYGEALQRDDGFVQARFNLGMLYSRAGKDPQAVAEFRRLTEQAPQMAIAWYRLGLVLARMRRYDEAEKVLLKASELEPGSFDYLYGLSVFYMERGKWDEAVGYAARLLRAYPNAPAARSLLRDIHRQRAGQAPRN